MYCFVNHHPGDIGQQGDFGQIFNISVLSLYKEIISGEMCLIMKFSCKYL